MSSGPAVLVLSGGRPGLVGYWLGQLRRVHNEYGNAMNYTKINFHKGVIAWLAGPVLALQWTHGMARRAS
jgi:hypothetical protein